MPKPIDPRILVRESAAVAGQAIREGVARRAIENESYQESLTVRLGTGRETRIQPLAYPHFEKSVWKE